MKTIGRNEPCPCGSGSKYKNCCEDKDKHPYMSRTGLILGLAVAVILTGGVAAIFNDPTNDAETERKLRDVLQGTTESPATAPAPVAASTTPVTSTPVTSTAPQAPVPQPPGPAPSGKVWSPEHGHWHSAPSVQVEASRQVGLSATASTQPPPSSGTGEAQPGMVWNEEHGHYHRADPAAAAGVSTADSGEAPATSVPRAQIPRISVGQDGVARGGAPLLPPPGPAPEGKVWSYEHGHWHDAQPAFPSGDFPADTPAASDPSSAEDPQ